MMVMKFLIGIITVYRRWISPFLPPHCRYYPTCSEYTVEAIQIHGSGRGCVLAAKRICRCHPWHPGGYDPVPSVEVQEP